MVDARLIAPLPTHLSRQTGALALLPPTLGERRHRGLARQLIPMCGAADVAVMAAGPHPEAVLRGDWYLEDAADNDAVLHHIKVILIPPNGGSLQDQWSTGAFLERHPSHSEGVIAKAMPAAAANRVLNTSWSSSQATMLARDATTKIRSEEHTSELQSLRHLV